MLNYKNRKNMKIKYVLFILVFCIVITIYGCGKKKDQDELLQLYSSQFTLYVIDLPEKYYIKSTDEISDDFLQQCRDIFTDKKVLNDILSELDYDISNDLLSNRITISSKVHLICVEVKDENQQRSHNLARLLYKHSISELESETGLKFNCVELP